MNTFGKRLKYEREKKGFNQKEFASAMGITPTRLNYWEKDKREPDFFHIKKMIDLLGCDADYLLGTKFAVFDKKNEKQQLTDLIDTLSKEQIILLTSFVQFLAECRQKPDS